MSNFEHIEIVFKKKDVLIFQRLTKSLCKKNDLYFSDIIKSIKGDVSSKLHLTIFYGLVHEKLDKVRLDKHIKQIKIPTLKLGNLFLMSGYKNLYQVLSVEVLDENNKLKEIAKSFKKFPFEESVQLGFKPHLTLAYLKPNFKPGEVPSLPKEISVKKIQYSR